MKRIEDLLNSLLAKPEDKTGLSAALNQGSSRNTVLSGESFDKVLAQVSGQGQSGTALTAPSLNQSQSSATNEQEPSSQSSVVPALTSDLQTPLQADLGAGTRVQNSPADTKAGTVVPSQHFQESFVSVSQVTVRVSETVRVSNPAQIQQAEQALSKFMTGLLSLLQTLSSANAGDQSATTLPTALNTDLGLQPADLRTLTENLHPFVQKLPEGQNPLLLNPEQQAQLLAQMIQQMAGAQQVLLNPNATVQSANGDQVQGVTSLGQAGSVTMASLQMNFSEGSLTESSVQNGRVNQVSIDLENFKMSATFVRIQGGSSESATSSNATPLGMDSIKNALNELARSAQTAPQLSSSVASPQSLSVANPGLTRNFRDLVGLLLQSGVTQAALTSFMNRNQETSSNNLRNASFAFAPETIPTSFVQPAAMETSIPPVTASLPVETAPLSLMGPAPDAAAINQLAHDLMENAGVVTNHPTPQKSFVANLKADQTVASPEPLAIPASNVPLIPNGIPASGPVGPAVQPIDVQTIMIHNDAVSRLNQMALHETQGSLTFGNLHSGASQALTLNQVTASIAAAQLNSSVPAVLGGNPSVPQNIQDPSNVEIAIQNQVIQREIVAAVTQAQNATLTPSNGSSVGQNQDRQVAATISTVENSANSVVVASDTPQTPQTVVVNPELPSTPSAGVPTVPTTVVSNRNDIVSTTPAPTKPVEIAPVPAAPNTASTNISRPATIPHTVVLPSPVTAPVVPVSGTAAPLEQTILPPPTSQTPLVPLSAVVGEGVKAEIPLQLNPGAVNHPPVTTGTFQPMNTVQPVSPEGVGAVASVLSADTSVQVSGVSDKLGAKDTTSFDVIPLVNLSAGVATRPDADQNFSVNLNRVPNTAQQNLDASQVFNLVTGQIVSQMGQAKNVSRLNFQLVPENLGKVTVQMALVDQSLSARIFVSNPEVRDNLQSHLVDLKTAMSQAGLQIDQLQVQVQGGGANLLAQYYQYQQEGYGSRGSSGAPVTPEVLEIPENIGVLAGVGARMALVDFLA